MDDWNSLKYVLAITRHGGLSGAARALGVNHATVSRQLDRCEALLGRKLFERLHNGLVPTEAGNTLAAHAAKIEQETVALDLALAATGDALTGSLTVTTPPLLMTAALARDFCDFKEKFPRINLHIVGDNRVLNLHQREADVAFRVSNSPAESLWGRKVASQHSGYFGAEPLFSKLLKQPEAPIPVVAFTAWAGMIPEDFTSQFRSHECVATCDDMVAALSLVRAGLGVTRLPCFLGRETPGLELLPNQELQDYPGIWVLTHPDLRATTRIAEFMSFMGDRFAARSADYL